MITDNKKILAHKVRFCKTSFSKFKGLMFSKKLFDEGLVFIFDKPKKISLHMFFVFFPIDVLWLDEHKHVIELKENFKPFTIHNGVESKYVIELPEGVIARGNIKKGDRIRF
jgi:uncharacterized membrane protein (UPF0127 family)